MRKHILRVVVYLAVVGGDLAWSPPSQAQALGGQYQFSEMDPANRKKIKRRQRLITFGVLGVVGLMVMVVLGLNNLEKKSERRKLMQLYAERMEKGLI